MEVKTNEKDEIIVVRFVDGSLFGCVYGLFVQ